MKTESIERLELAAMGTKRPERAQAAFELARRLRELVPLLEEALTVAKQNSNTYVANRLEKGIALAKGGEEKR